MEYRIHSGVEVASGAETITASTTSYYSTRPSLCQQPDRQEFPSTTRKSDNHGCSFSPEVPDFAVRDHPCLGINLFLPWKSHRHHSRTTSSSTSATTCGMLTTNYDCQTMIAKLWHQDCVTVSGVSLTLLYLLCSPCFLSKITSDPQTNDWRWSPQSFSSPVTRRRYALSLLIWFIYRLDSCHTLLFVGLDIPASFVLFLLVI